MGCCGRLYTEIASLGLRGKKTRSSLNDTISTAYFTQSLEPGWSVMFNLLKPTGYVIHQQFNIQQLYALPTLYLCVLCLSENKQRLVPLSA